MRRFTKQTPVPYVGTFKHLLGGASTWITLGIFVFSGIAAWNTSTLAAVREWLPWLTLPVFVVIVLVGLSVAMWVEYRWVQPSVMVFWNTMHFNHGNLLLRKVEEMEKGIGTLEKSIGALEKQVGALTDEIRRDSTEDDGITG